MDDAPAFAKPPADKSLVQNDDIPVDRNNGEISDGDLWQLSSAPSETLLLDMSSEDPSLTSSEPTRIPIESSSVSDTTNAVGDLLSFSPHDAIRPVKTIADETSASSSDLLNFASDASTLANASLSASTAPPPVGDFFNSPQPISPVASAPASLLSSTIPVSSPLSYQPTNVDDESRKKRTWSQPQSLDSLVDEAKTAASRSVTPPRQPVTPTTSGTPPEKALSPVPLPTEPVTTTVAARQTLPPTRPEPQLSSPPAPVSEKSSEPPAESQSTHETVVESSTEVKVTAPTSPSKLTHDSSINHATANQTIAALQKELAEAKAIIEFMKKQQQDQGGKEEDRSSKDAEIQDLIAKLDEQMKLREVAQESLRLAESKIKELEGLNASQVRDAESDLAALQQLQSDLEIQESLTRREEKKVNDALERIEKMEEDKAKQAEEIKKLERQLVQEREINAALREERDLAVEEKNEEERKQFAMTSRLNAAKKNEAAKADLAERLEEEVKTLQSDLSTSKSRLAEVLAAKEAADHKLRELQTSSEEKVRQIETLLADERTLNEERKRKMRAFVESKAEELNQAKADIEALQAELDQTNHSLKETHNRWKTQHAQWVQAQTRNRELQRDLNRIKKDSENLHKVGDTLEMKLSRSATETEEHKNKRLAAKHELMTVLRTLEAERELSARLRDSLKFTFTPKALSQQQLLKEGLEDFEEQLQKLSLRLGRQLPPRPGAASLGLEETDPSESESSEINGDDSSKLSRSEAEVRRLIAKLEYETQRTSQCIMAFSGSIERMSSVLNASGDRTCFTALGEIFTTGGMVSSPAARSLASSGSQRPLTAIRSHRYGQVPHETTEDAV